MRSGLLALLVGISTLAASQNPIAVRSLSTVDGLSQNSITQILEDPEGYIWLSSQDGLNRYNGYEFEVFRPNADDPFSLGDNYIIQMILDPDGRLWLNTRDGVSVFEASTRRFYKVIKNPHNPVRIFYQMIDIGNRIYLSDHSDGSYKTWSLPINQTFDQPYTVIDSIGQVEPVPIVYPGVLYKTFDGESWVFSLQKGMRVSDERVFDIPDSLFLNGSPELWEVYQMDKNRALIAHPKKLIILHTDSLFIEVLCDSVGAYSFQPFYDGIALATNQGLKLLNPQSGTLSDLPVTSQALKTTLVHHLLTDSYGQLWIGTANQGVFIHQPQAQSFQYLQAYEQPSQPVVWDASFRNRSWYLATDDGLQIIEDGKELKSLLKGIKVTALANDSNGLWIGTSKGDLYRLPKEENEPKKICRVRQAPLTHLMVKRGKLLIASHKGLSKLENFKLTHSEDELLIHTQNYLFTLYEDQSGNLWAGSANGCFYQKKDGSFVAIPYLKGSPQSMNFNFVSGFAEDRTGRLWMATYGGGLSRLNADSTFTHFTEKDGLPNNVIYAICTDNQGFLWLTSNGGLTRFDPTSFESVTYTTLDGLKSHNFAISSIRNSGNEISVGTSEGLLFFDPTKLQPKANPPRILWEDIQINYQSILETPPNSMAELTLRPDDKVFSVHFTGIKYDHQADIHYAYQLAGFDTTWVPVSPSSRIISYSSLPYGTYTLRVQASSQNHHFAPVERSLQIIVSKPYWLSWWFISSLVVSSFGLLIAIVAYVARRKLKKRLSELETESRIQAERHRISRDLHDSVGTHFAYIISRLDYLFLSWEKEAVIEDKRSYLGSLSDFARSGMRLLRETIWALDAPHVNAISLKSKIGDYLAFCLTSPTPRYSFDFQSDMETIPSPTALHCFRIIQEAVSNCQKHASANQLTISLNFSETGFELEIEDDGQGFDPNSGREDGYGLKNMKTRAEELGATFEIESVHGTQIRIAKELPK